MLQKMMMLRGEDLKSKKSKFKEIDLIYFALTNAFKVCYTDIINV